MTDRELARRWYRRQVREARRRRQLAALAANVLDLLVARAGRASWSRDALVVLAVVSALPLEHGGQTDD